MQLQHKRKYQVAPNHNKRKNLFLATLCHFLLVVWNSRPQSSDWFSTRFDQGHWETVWHRASSAFSTTTSALWPKFPFEPLDFLMLLALNAQFICLSRVALQTLQHLEMKWFFKATCQKKNLVESLDKHSTYFCVFLGQNERTVTKWLWELCSPTPVVLGQYWRSDFRTLIVQWVETAADWPWRYDHRFEFRTGSERFHKKRKKLTHFLWHWI